MKQVPDSLLAFQHMFPDDDACAAWLIEMRWPDGFVCPACGHEKGWALRRKAHTFECAGCRRQTSVTAGTILHASKLPLTVWFWAAYLMATHSNGISALQLQKQLGIGSYRSAWLLAHKLRASMVDPERNPLSGLVEIDEASLPFRTKDDPEVTNGQYFWTRQLRFVMKLCGNGRLPRAAKALMTTRLATNHDILFVYQMAERATWNADAAFIPYDPNNLDSRTASKYRHLDADGRVYRLDNLTNPNRNRPNLTYEFMGVTRVWRWTQERMLEAYDAGLIVQNKPGGVPQLKRYLDEQKGRPVGDVWADIPPINSQAKERIGYPTQKPLALLRRIITLSTYPDDFVLDPFCGCATALVAADRLQRKWAGIDLSPLAIKLVNERIAGDRAATKEAEHNPVIGGSLFRVTALTEPPSRTDLGDLPNYRTHRHRLYGVQEGVCAGCETHFPFRVMDVDHMLPRSRGGTDHPDNLQLLCSGCNRSKGGKTMAEWRAAQ